MQHLSRAQKLLGRVLRERRMELAGQPSQRVIASRSGLDPSYYGSVERGERNISFTSLIRVAQALGCQPSELLARFEVDIGWEQPAHSDSDAIDASDAIKTPRRPGAGRITNGTSATAPSDDER